MRQVKRIKEMEDRLDKSRAVADDLTEVLDSLESVLEDYLELAGYYGSAEWFDDFDDQNAGKLPEDLKCGVLSEDLPYDLIVDMNDQAIRMLELATRIVKEG